MERHVHAWSSEASPEDLQDNGWSSWEIPLWYVTSSVFQEADPSQRLDEKSHQQELGTQDLHLKKIWGKDRAQERKNCVSDITKCRNFRRRGQICCLLGQGRRGMNFGARAGRGSNWIACRSMHRPVRYTEFSSCSVKTQEKFGVML